MTRSGWTLLVGSLAVYGAGSLLGSRELNALGATGLLVLAAALATMARPVAFAVERRVVPMRVTVGERAEGVLTVTNRLGRRSPSVLGREPLTGSRPGLAPIELAVGRLAPRRAQTVPYELPTDRRGVVQVGPFVVSRGDPFGLVARHHRSGEPSTLWVHPRLHAVRPLPLGNRRDLDGPTVESARGETVFHSLREYVLGDDLRRVHWKATAHSGTLMVREHVDPARPDVTVVLDDRDGSGVDADRFDLMVEIVASVSVAARRGGFPVGLTSVSGALRPPPHADDTRLLDLLAGAVPVEHEGLDAVSSRLLAGRGGQALVVVSGRPRPGELLRWSAAGRYYGSVVVVAVPARAGPGAPPAPEGEGAAPPAGMTVLRVHSAAEFVRAWGGL